MEGSSWRVTCNATAGRAGYRVAALATHGDANLLTAFTACMCGGAAARLAILRGRVVMQQAVIPQPVPRGCLPAKPSRAAAVLAPNKPGPGERLTSSSP